MPKSVPFSKYMRLSNYLDGSLRAIRRTFPNLIVDRLIHASNWDNLTRELTDVEMLTLQFSSEELEEWARQYYPNYKQQFGEVRHKKLLEFYATYKILNPQSHHVFMDAAGGANSYLARLNCKSKILQDIRISASTRKILGENVEYIECDAGAVPLPDRSVDSISCHHSFEHFQQDSDINFIKEVQRLLTIDGKCCIVPIFIANRYAEITDKLSLRLKFDPAASRIIDPTASIPGTEFSGNYARVYDIRALQHRLLKHIDAQRFNIKICALTLDGALLPDMALKCHRTVTAVNFPYRALVLQKIAA